MDESEKQRLVGAAVLLTLAVIVLPLLFGDPQDPAATIRSSFEGEAVRTLPAPVTDATPQAPLRPLAVDLSPADEPPAAAPAAKTASASPPAVPPAAAAAPQAPERGWVLQMGSYKAEGNARALRDRLRAAGHAAWYEAARVNGKRWFRVRVGPIGEETAARKLKSALESEYRVQIALYPPG